MPLFSGTGGPKLKLTRPVIIMMGVLGGLLVIVVVLFILVSSGVFSGQTTNKAAAPTAPVKVGEADATTMVLPTALPTVPPAPVTPIPTAPPAATVGGAEPPPPAGPTAIPAPTVDPGAGAAQPVTPGGEGSGELSSLPEVSSGLPWLIPVGALLLGVVAWWRWRRARAEGQ